MTIQSVILTGYEEKFKQTDNTPYWSFSSNLGNLTCFEPKIKDDLLTLLNKQINLNIVVNGNFKNIRGIADGVVGQPETVKNSPIPIVPPIVNMMDAKDKAIARLVYIKGSIDIFNAIQINGKEYKYNMETAIALVKEASEAF